MILWEEGLGCRWGLPPPCHPSLQEGLGLFSLKTS